MQHWSIKRNPNRQRFYHHEKPRYDSGFGCYYSTLTHKWKHNFASVEWQVNEASNTTDKVTF